MIRILITQKWKIIFKIPNLFALKKKIDVVVPKIKKNIYQMSPEEKEKNEPNFLDKLRNEKFTIKPDSEEANIEPSSPDKVKNGVRLD